VNNVPAAEKSSAREMNRVAGLFISTTHVTSKSSREEFVKTLTQRDVLLKPHFNGGIDVIFLKYFYPTQFPFAHV